MTYTEMNHYQKHDVFISYARKDGSEFASDLQIFLEHEGITVWRDQRNINPFQDFSSEIEVAIQNSTHVIVCLSPSITTRNDSFVRREIVYAQNWNKPITPIVLPKFDTKYIPVLVSHLTWLQFNNFASDLPHLLERLRNPADLNTSYSSNDPFLDYLYTLQREIVGFLDQTVFNLIDLHSSSSDHSNNLEQEPYP